MVDLCDPSDRRDYFASAFTTTAFFSYLSVLIVKRERWNSVEVMDEFLGSLWIHVTKILSMIRDGLCVKYLPEPLVLKRGDNDAFLDHGTVKRYAVAIEGFSQIADHFFGEESYEAFHIRRALRYEHPLGVLIEARRRCVLEGDTPNLRHLNRLVARLYSDLTLLCVVNRYVYEHGSLAWAYRAAYALRDRLRDNLGWR